MSWSRNLYHRNTFLVGQDLNEDGIIARTSCLLQKCLTGWVTPAALQVVAKPQFKFLESSLYSQSAVLVWDPSGYNGSLQSWSVLILTFSPCLVLWWLTVNMGNLPLADVRLPRQSRNTFAVTLSYIQICICLRLGLQITFVFQFVQKQIS